MLNLLKKRIKPEDLMDQYSEELNQMKELEIESNTLYSMISHDQALEGELLKVMDNLVPLRIEFKEMNMVLEKDNAEIDNQFLTMAEKDELSTMIDETSSGIEVIQNQITPLETEKSGIEHQLDELAALKERKKSYDEQIKLLKSSFCEKQNISADILAIALAQK